MAARRPPTLRGEFVQRRTHEHAQTLVGRADHGLSRPVMTTGAHHLLERVLDRRVGVREGERDGLGDAHLRAGAFPGGDLRRDRSRGGPAAGLRTPPHLQRRRCRSSDVSSAATTVKRAGPPRLPSGCRDRAHAFERIRHALVEVQRAHPESYECPLLLGSFDVAQDERHPRAVVARHDAHEQILARLGDRGRAIEVSEGVSESRRPSARAGRGPLRQRLGPPVRRACGASPSASFSSASAVAASSPGNRRRGRRLRGQRHGRGILVAALGEEALGFAQAVDDLVGGPLPHLAPHGEEQRGRAGVLPRSADASRAARASTAALR